jgi:hypothetical protein
MPRARPQSNVSRKAAKRAAWLIREQLKNSGTEYTLPDFEAQCRVELAPYSDIAFADFVRQIVTEVDEEDTTERPAPATPSLFPDFHLEGSYKLGGGRRVKRASALIEHADEILANDDNNLAAVLQANAKKRREVAALRPHWSQPGTTKEQAVAAYREANPPPPTE